jgi:hypothetical protein
MNPQSPALAAQPVQKLTHEVGELEPRAQPLRSVGRWASRGAAQRAMVGAASPREHWGAFSSACQIPALATAFASGAPTANRT